MKPALLLAVLLLAVPLWAGEGAIRLKTDTAGVEVFLDGASVGKTPMTIKAAPGAHQLKLVKDGFEDQVRDVQVDAAAPAKLFIVMKAVQTPLPPLPVTFFALHQHRAGMCSGMLTVTAEGLDYLADDNTDKFHIPFATMRHVTRGMGALPNITWGLSGEYSGLRIDVPDRNFGFFAYDGDDPSIPKTAPGKRGDVVRFDQTSKKTAELFKLVHRLWLPTLKAHTVTVEAQKEEKEEKE